jgi:hypothetical protein
VIADHEQLQRRMQEALTEAAAHCIGVQRAAFFGLLDAVYDATLADLARAQPERVTHMQGALAQLRALQTALDDPGLSPKP